MLTICLNPLNWIASRASRLNRDLEKLERLHRFVSQQEHKIQGDHYPRWVGPMAALRSHFGYRRRLRGFPKPDKARMLGGRTDLTLSELGVLQNV